MKSDIGRAGEQEAARFLERKGYRILERNVRTTRGEIDIVAREKDTICFVEVRSRSGADHRAQAFESVGRAKQERLSRLAIGYLKEKNWLDRPARFDVAAVTLESGIAEVTLIKDAFPVAEKYKVF